MILSFVLCCMYTAVVTFYFFIFVFNDTATTEIYTYCHTLALHAALPIFEDEREAFIDEMREAAEQAATGPARAEVKLREAIRLGVRRIATDWTGQKPVVDVMLVNV